MRIRTASEADLTACGEIYSAAFSAPPYAEYWDPGDAAAMLGGILEKDPGSCWVAEDDGQVVGFAFCTAFGKFRATIHEFAVTPAWQGKGVGTALMQHLLDDFRRRGVRTADLVANQNAPAYEFYRKFGFERPKRYVLMTRWL